VQLDDDMQRVVQQQSLGFVATVCADGTPNLSPKGTLTVWDDEHLCFLDICSPATVANLRDRPAVEVNVVDPILRKGYRFKGQGAVLTEGPLHDDVLARYQRERGTDPARVQTVVVIAVETAAALVSPAYATGASENDIAARWRAHHLALHPEG